MSPLTGKKIKSTNNSADRYHLLHCSCLPSLGYFSILVHENKKYLLEIKESLLIMNEKLSLNRNMSSASFYQFLMTIFSSFHVSLSKLVSLFQFKERFNGQYSIMNLQDCNKESFYLI